MASYNYRRRPTVTVNVGSTPMGSDYPIRIQSMTNTTTTDVEASLRQVLQLADAGAEYVRLTAQGTKEADSIGQIRQLSRERGCQVPLVADIHFNRAAALAAARVTDKVRINPGNFVDAARTFRHLEYTDAEYADELGKIREALLPLIDICKAEHRAVRIGVNHGSLSDRIMSRYGDTPAGMVESAMEFLRVFVAENFLDVVISIKASNAKVMVETVRRLVVAMDAEDMHFPLHLGVTEAGDGATGRLKSATGIGTLLSDGIGDTIRVSLSEDPVAELPVARKIVDYIATRQGHRPIVGECSREPLPPRRRSREVGIVGGNNQPIVVSDVEGTAADFTAMRAARWLHLDAEQDIDLDAITDHTIIVATTTNANIPGAIEALAQKLDSIGRNQPIIVHVTYPDTDAEWLQVKAGCDLGTLLMNGIADGIWLSAPRYDRQAELAEWAFTLLQAARLRTTATEYISCPSCGRTLFDLQGTVKEIKAATSHLTHLKIGIMGCIVNGPGEMADADYGYVGAGPGRISLYKGKQCVEKNIEQQLAIPHLIALIKAHGDWRDP